MCAIMWAYFIIYKQKKSQEFKRITKQEIHKFLFIKNKIKKKITDKTTKN